MKESNGNGKGSKPRNNFSQQFRDGWDLAFRGKRKRKKPEPPEYSCTMINPPQRKMKSEKAWIEVPITVIENFSGPPENPAPYTDPYWNRKKK